MTDGEIFRLFAFQVEPKQEDGFIGGAIGLNSGITRTLEGAYISEKVEAAAEITLHIATDPNLKRAHYLRETMILLAFNADPKKRKAAALAIVTRLGQSMDNRSPKENLLIISVHYTTKLNRVRVVLWTFPQEEVFRLDVSKSNNLILQEAFVQKSNFRKIASFEGENDRVGFLKGRVLDPQSGARTDDIAHFWLEKFLYAKLAIGGKEGVRILSKALSDSHNKASSVEAKDEFLNAIVALGSYNAAKVSIKSVGSEFLDPIQQKLLRSQVMNEETYETEFDFDKTLFRTKFPREIYELQGGVIVSKPMTMTGDATSITVEEVEKGGPKKLTVSGIILTTKLRGNSDRLTEAGKVRIAKPGGEKETIRD